jgi:3-oxoacyl-[acyl-carrier protein] reductase
MSNKKAIITGGSRGIGKAITLKLAQQGYDVAVIYSGNETAAKETCLAAEEYGAKAKAYKCNVSDFILSKETVSAIIKEMGRIDVLVNNAGITRDGLIFTMKEADYDAVLDINLKGSFNMIKHCYSNFIKNKSGRIINISSVSGIMGNAGQANYSASKAGLIGLTKSVARELAAKGVCCNAVAPGYIATEMTAALSDEQKNNVASTIPLGFLGSTEDIAEIVAFLASDKARYITGEVIRVDGGMAM